MNIDELTGLTGYYFEPKGGERVMGVFGFDKSGKIVKVIEGSAQTMKEFFTDFNLSTSVSQLSDELLAQFEGVKVTRVEHDGLGPFKDSDNR